jgi:hypothetical protein
MHGPINVKSPNNISKWQMGFNSAFKGLTVALAGVESSAAYTGRSQPPEIAPLTTA